MRKFFLISIFILLPGFIKFSLKAQDTAFIYLSDFVIHTDHVRYHDVGVGVDHPWGKPGKTISIYGNKYDKGIAIMSDWMTDSYVMYQLESQFLRFTAIMGISDYAHYPFEWAMIDTAGRWVRQYRGCKDDPDGLYCDSLDQYIPGWPGQTDIDNQFVELYENHSPNRRILMIRPACYTKVFLDEGEAYHSGYIARSESYESPLDTVDIDLSGKNMMKISAYPHGYQYEPFDDHDVFVSDCPWNDLISYANPKLYYIKSLKGISLDKSKLTLDQFEQDTLHVKLNPDTAYLKHVKYESSNPDVVSVVNPLKGIIEGAGGGTATVTATSYDGNYQDSCVVTVQGTSIGEIIGPVDISTIVKNPSPLSNVEIDLSDFSDKSRVHVKIYSLSGELLYSRGVHANRLHINLTGIAGQGFCIVQVTAAQKAGSTLLLLQD